LPPRRSLDRRTLELLEDGVGGNALNAIVTDLTSDIPEQGSPRVWWFYGTGSEGAHEGAVVQPGDVHPLQSYDRLSR
jgi:hypothetical protein